MGSLDKAILSGFLCRLCSEMHRIVFHIYGDQGKKHGLEEKINGYLPVTITPTDPLPKTICKNCLQRVEQHYELYLRIKQLKEGQKKGNLSDLFKSNSQPLQNDLLVTTSNRLNRILAPRVRINSRRYLAVSNAVVNGRNNFTLVRDNENEANDTEN